MIRDAVTDLWRRPWLTLTGFAVGTLLAPLLLSAIAPRFDELIAYARENRVEHIFLLVPAQRYVGQFIGTFREFPPSQKGGSFSLDAVLQALQPPGKTD